MLGLKLCKLIAGAYGQVMSRGPAITFMLLLNTRGVMQLVKVVHRSRTESGGKKKRKRESVPGQAAHSLVQGWETLLSAGVAL